ncbi:uncharacterized protein BDZ99DRAFT_234768 [Mytilinidion resinicola]|uniref:Uncharacterized protein n=1 Tax=Mytilinidion resinicola TaxID=574789 RepID=A0A6A6Z0R5_9PEZI|nr:uncharacterized protein BDZ99DRAFT_234768 [Mytilinidion resinicola]KAF2814293.1 hypothetical protein BDZ99DRAFT_234768 [Mytilinidion resinicola]
MSDVKHSPSLTWPFPRPWWQDDGPRSDTSSSGSDLSGPTLSQSIAPALPIPQMRSLALWDSHKTRDPLKPVARGGLRRRGDISDLKAAQALSRGTYTERDTTRTQAQSVSGAGGSAVGSGSDTGSGGRLARGAKEDLKENRAGQKDKDKAPNLPTLKRVKAMENLRGEERSGSGEASHCVSVPQRIIEAVLNKQVLIGLLRAVRASRVRGTRIKIRQRMRAILPPIREEDEPDSAEYRASQTPLKKPADPAISEYDTDVLESGIGGQRAVLYTKPATMPQIVDVPSRRVGYNIANFLQRKPKSAPLSVASPLQNLERGLLDDLTRADHGYRIEAQVSAIDPQRGGGPASPRRRRNVNNGNEATKRPAPLHRLRAPVPRN